LLALASSLMWGVGDFLAGELSRRRAAIAVAGAVQVVGLAFMLAVSILSGAWMQGISVGSYAGWAVLASFSGLGGLIAFYTALGSGQMGIVSPIAALGVLVPLAVGLVQGEQPAPWQMIGILLAVVGVVLASGPELSGGAGARPVGLAVLAALLFGLFFVFAAQGSESSPVLTMTVQRITSSILVLSAAAVVRSVGGLQREDAGRLVVVGVLDVGANLAFSFATTLGMLAVVSVLGSVYPVVTVLLAWLVLGERLKPVQYVGAAVTITAVAMIAAG
jgi:drug/metabolite transporter (DMT)-like permease